MKIPFELPLLAILMTSAFAPLATAGDIGAEIRNGTVSPSSDDGGYIELGLGMVATDGLVLGESKEVGLYPFIHGRYQWNGLFIETPQDLSGHLSVGYKLWNNDQWSVEILGSQVNSSVISKDNEELQSISRDRLNNVEDLDFLLGGRINGYLGDNLVQFVALKDISDTHEGSVFSASAGRGWQVRNWNYHALVNLSHSSKEVVDFYLGVRPEEATETLPAYIGQSGSVLSVQFGAIYPITDHWVFRATGGVSKLSSSLSETPILEDDESFQVSTVLSYVF